MTGAPEGRHDRPKLAHDGSLTALTGRWAEPVMLAGTVMSAYGLAFVAAEGFAPDGHFPWLTALIFAAGVLLVALRPAEL